MVGIKLMWPDPGELEESLWRDLLNPWFPICLDPNGGFIQEFGPRFEVHDNGIRSLVFQSRMTWVCATVAAQRAEFGEYARHGVRFLRDRLDGGLSWAPGDGERHAYGIAFAIYGLAAAARLLRDEEALGMAMRLFRYLELAHADPQYGGYFEVSDLEGRPRLTGEGGDAIGTPYGQKSQNTHLHLMEAFAELYRVNPDPAVGDSLQRLVGIFTDELYHPEGHLHLFVRADWTPVSTETSYGHDIEAAHLLWDAVDALGVASDRVDAVTRSLADNVLARGWDAEFGGIFYAGTDDGPEIGAKNWWAQAESLLGFATMWARTGDERYGRAMAEQWAFIRDHQIDPGCGWHEETERDGTPRIRAKGHAWKAAYHDGRAVLFTGRILRVMTSR